MGGYCSKRRKAKEADVPFEKMKERTELEGAWGAIVAHCLARAAAIATETARKAHITNAKYETQTKERLDEWNRRLRKLYGRVFDKYDEDRDGMLSGDEGRALTREALDDVAEVLPPLMTSLVPVLLEMVEKELQQITHDLEVIADLRRAAKEFIEARLAEQAQALVEARKSSGRVASDAFAAIGKGKDGRVKRESFLDGYHEQVFKQYLDPTLIVGMTGNYKIDGPGTDDEESDESDDEFARRA